MTQGVPVTRLGERLRLLPSHERKLLSAFFVFSVIALAIGGLGALMLVMDVGGLLDLGPFKYVFLTLHATYAFNYWLYFAQVGLMLGVLLAYTEGTQMGSTLRRVVWAGLLLMVTGFLMDLAAVLGGAAVTYAALWPLSLQYDGVAAMFVTGYLVLFVGLLLCGVAALIIAIRPKLSGRIHEWSSPSFAVVLWTVLLIITVLASFQIYLPEAVALVAGSPQTELNYEMAWSVMFHNLHYLPIMSTVILWYVLAEATTGVRSIFGERISKFIFSLYLIVVPPTSVYHLFLEPGLPETVKIVGSVLSLGVSVPTIAVSVLILTSLEACARGEGAKGLKWLGKLPWRNPFFSAMALAMISAVGGGVGANVLIQERLAPLLSDTLAVPGYFHFLTLGAVTLTMMAAILYMSSAIKRGLWAPRLAALSPYVIVGGTYLFGAAGIAAGLAGLPRRTLDYSFGGTIALPSSWETLPVVIGVGGLLMVIGGLTYLATLVGTLAGLGNTSLVALPTATFRADNAWGQRPWFAIVIVAVLLIAIFLLTVIGAQLIQEMPTVSGGHS